jgi:hypothetical protein
LQLDAVEMRREPLIGPLKATMELLIVPSDASSQRLEAALWKVLVLARGSSMENQRLTALKAEATGQDKAWQQPASPRFHNFSATQMLKPVNIKPNWFTL